ncbi:hypothetical protein [Streptomyces sp. NPDC059003]|uniref:hypothetical protein n=1 Tax=Streptomyces sp. NPDC059003 TaxID=3346691 RepID=UPI0036C13C66
MVWGRVDRMGAREVVRKAVWRHLTAILNVCGPDVDAERVLRERLKRRLAEQGATHITDPVGWLMSRGLPRRSVCLESRCDDGRRMDTRADCQACVLQILDGRALRARAAKLASAALGGDGVMAKAAGEKELCALWRREAEATAARHAETIRMREAAAAATAEHRAEVQARHAAWEAQPCADCGQPESAGLCGSCRDRREVPTFQREAIDVAVATWGLGSNEQAQLCAERVEADVRRTVEQAVKELRDTGTSQAAALDLAERLATQSHLHAVRQAALNCLATGGKAQEEAERVFAAEMRCRHYHDSWEAAQKAAGEASEKARWRTAHHLLDQQLREVRAIRARAVDTETEPDPYQVQADRVRAAMNWSPPSRRLSAPGTHHAAGKAVELTEARA